MQQQDDLLVIETILKGKADAYAMIVDRYQAFVFTLVLRYVTNREVAEELAQDVFIKAYRSLADFKGNSKFSTWLYTITSTTCLSYLRRRKDQTILPGDEKMVLLSDYRQQQPEQDDKKQELQLAMSRLPAEDATIITLHYHGEQSLEEIGKIMGITATNAKVKLFRARQKLRGLMQQKTMAAKKH